MDCFNNMIVTDIKQPVMVFSRQGENAYMTNRKSYGLSLCLDGQITYVMDGREYVSAPGYAVLLPKGCSYTLHRDKTGIFPLINFQCSNFSCDTFRVFPLQDPQSCMQTFEKLQKQFLVSENRLLVCSLFYKLLDQVSRIQTPLQSLLSPSIRYLEQNLSDPNLSNTLLAQQAGISEVYFRKLFTQQYQTTPRQYILDLRIQSAKQLLIGANCTVTVVAEKCGFTSAYHFCRSFKQRTGFTPMEWAAKNRIYKL